MKRLKIVKKEEYNYTLEDENLNKYTKAINFYDTRKPVVGDIIYIPEVVLKEKNIFSYGLIKNEEVDIFNPDDLIKIKTESEEYYLKRLYG